MEFLVTNIKTQKRFYYINGRRVTSGKYGYKMALCNLEGKSANSLRTVTEKGKRKSYLFMD